jgi:hypothetical protein
VYRYSLRELVAVIVACSASFAIAFVPAKSVGALFYFFIIESALVAICLIVVHCLVGRRAITIGVLLTFAAALGVIISLRSLWAAPRFEHLTGFAILLGILGMGPMFITIPLTLHRLAIQRDGQSASRTSS